MKIRYQQGGQTFTVEFDATLREIHTSAAQATSHPVEKDSDISDHVQVAQPKLSIEAVVSSAPIKEPGSHMDGIKGSARKLSLNAPDSRYITFGVTTVRVPTVRQVGAMVLQFDGKFDRPKNVHATLVDIVEGATLVEITNGLRDYEDMIITNLSAPRETLGSIKFTFDAVHIDFVETSTTETPRSTTKRRSRGNKGTKEAKPETKEYESLTHKLKDWAVKALTQ